MKKNKLILPLAVSLLTVSLTGCSTGIKVHDHLAGEGTVYTDINDLVPLEDKKAESFIKAFNKKFSEQAIKSGELEMSIIADLSAGDEDLKMDISMNFYDNMTFDASTQTAHQNVTGSLSFLGIDMNLDADSYLIEEDGSLISYTKTNIAGEDSGWKKESVTDSSIFSDNEMLPDTITADAVKDIYYSEADGAYIVRFEPSKFKEFSESLENPIADISNYDLDFSDVDYYMTLDSGLGVVGYYIDLSKGINFNDSDELSINKLSVKICFTSINEDVDIHLPAEAKYAEASDSKEDTTSLPIGTILDIPSETESADILNSSIDSTESEIDFKQETEISLNQDTYTLSESQVTVNGKNIKLPGSISDFEKAGFIAEDDSALIEAGGYDFIFLNTGTDVSMLLSVDNMTTTPLPAAQCTVTGISFDFYGDEANPNVFSAYGICPGDNLRKVQSVFGEPVYSYSGQDGYLSNDYEHNGCDITITFKNEIVNGISVYVN